MSKIDDEELAEAVNDAADQLTGWDILEIEKVTKRRFGELDGITIARSVMYVQERKKDSTYAWKNAMDVPYGQMKRYFVEGRDANPLPQEKPE